MIIVKAQKALEKKILRKTPSTTKKKTKTKTSKKPNFSYPENNHTYQENAFQENAFQESIIPVDPYADFIKNWYTEILEISDNPNPEVHYLKLQQLPPDVLIECLKDAAGTIYDLRNELEDYEDSFGVLMNYEEN